MHMSHVSHGVALSSQSPLHCGAAAGDNTLTTRWRFSCLLDLPWRPRLAAAGGTTHVIDPARGLVVRHEER